MKIFVISLKGSPRREVMQNQMDKLGIDFEFFDAIDGRAGCPKEYEHLIDKKAIRKNKRRDMTDREIGCALSHKLLYDKIVDEEIEHTVILEDDAIIDEDFKEVLEAKVLEKDEVGFVFLYSIHCRILKSSKQSFFGKYVSYKPIKSFSGAMAYYIDLEMANVLKTSRKRIKSVADDWSTLDSKNRKILYPRLVTHPLPLLGQTTIVDRDKVPKVKENIIKKILRKTWVYRVLKKMFFNIKGIEDIYGEPSGKFDEFNRV